MIAGPCRFAVKRCYRFLTALLILSLAASCSELVKPQAQRPPGWQAQHDQQAELQRWRLNARMALQTTTQGGSMDVFWRQSDGQFDIRLIAPLGQGAAQLKGDSDRVEARFGNGEQLTGEPSMLMQQHFGVKIPVRALSYWLRGIALDADYDDASWNEQGLLHELRQQGWRVEMREYKNISGHAMPTRFYLELLQDEDTNLRFIIRQWKLETG